MQISRHLLLTCAVAACLTPTLVHAADNEAQIRARQALEEKMNQMRPAAAPTNPAPAVSKPNAAAVKPPVQQSQPPVVTVTPKSTTVESQPAPSTPIRAFTPSNDAATQQKLQDALNQAASQPKPAMQQPAPPVVTVRPNTATTTVESQPAPVAQPAPATPSYISTPSNDDATNQKLQEALRQKMQQTPAEQTPAPTMTQKPAKSTTAPNYSTQPAPTPAHAGNYAPVPTTDTTHPNLPEQPTPMPAPVANRNQPMPPPTLNLPALQGPATGLSSTKEQKLNELLNQYRADQISPQQYHEQRAKILAEP